MPKLHEEVYLVPYEKTLRKYGFSEDNWVELLKKQGNVCYLCSNPSKQRPFLLVEDVLVCVGCYTGTVHAKRRAEREQAVDLEGKKTCIKCGEEKRLDEFPKSRKNRKGRPRYSYCKPCHSKYQRKQALKFFNITEEEYDKIFKFQEGACALCKRPPKHNRLAVDHDHKTGLIRGLLCPWCNRAIGFFRDDPERMQSVVSYFKEPPAVTVIGTRFGCKGRTTNKKRTVKRLNPRPKIEIGYAPQSTTPTTARKI